MKRRQRYQWVGLLSFEKPMDQDADSVPMEEGNTTTTPVASGCSVLRKSGEPGTLRNNMCTRTGRSPARLGRTIKAGPAKAINRTADMNACRESDCAVVPMRTNRTRRGDPRRRSGRAEGHRLRRTSFHHTCARHRAGKVCPRDWTGCGKQQEQKEAGTVHRSAPPRERRITPR